MIGTKGISYYPYYMLPVNYYDDAKYLYDTNDSGCFRLIFIEEGLGSIWVNDKRITVLPLTMICINENEMITKMELSGVKLQMLCFLPTVINNRLTLDIIYSEEGLSISDTQDKQYILPFIQRDQTYSESQCIDMKTGFRIRHILKNLKEQILIQSDSWPCLTRSYCIELLFLVERTCHLYQSRKEQQEGKIKYTAEDVQQYIHNNYMNKISISDLAKNFHTNRTTLSKLFKEETGDTIINYTLKTRVEVAAGMLRDTYMKIEIIIERVGFHNISHFNKIFKKYLNCMPSEYRKIARNES